MPISFKSLGASVPVLKTQKFLSTSSWTAPADCYAVKIFAVGGGGAGGSRGANNTPGGGGGGGQVIDSFISVTPSTSYTVTIGAGGAAAGYQTNASNGTNTTFGALLTAFGGGAGLYGQQISGFPAIAATGGGQGGSGGGSTASGGGGGAFGNGQNAGRGNNRDSTFAPINSPINRGLYGGAGGLGTDGLSGWPSGNGGEGLMGFGGGGGGGSYNYSYSGKGVHGGGDGATVDPGEGNPGRANSGGGGGGCRGNSSSVNLGGNGGSGYVEISYWTAT